MLSDTENARLIVSEILKEIEERIRASVPEEQDLPERFQEQLQKIQDAVLRDCAQGITDKYLVALQEMLGNEIVEYLKQESIDNAVWIKIVILLKCNGHFNQECLKMLREINCRRQIQDEHVDSQVGHIREAEMLESRLRDFQMLMMVVIEPFEDAIKTILSYLEAQQIEVFLYDDDKFLTPELRTDGRRFIYDPPYEGNLPSSQTPCEIKTGNEKETILEIPLVTEGQQIGYCRITRKSTDEFDKNEWKEKVQWLIPVFARLAESNKNRCLARKTYIDDITQLQNRRKFNEQIVKLFLYCKQKKSKLYIALIDIDKFKNLNNTYGQSVGDEVLKQAASIIKNEVHYVYRYGGCDFAAVLYGDDKDKTMQIMENIRKKTEDTPYIINTNELRITISAGIADLKTYMESVTDVIDRADQALYCSKQDGRNRCTYYDDVKERLIDDANKLRLEILELKERLSRAEFEKMQLARQHNPDSANQKDKITLH